MDEGPPNNISELSPLDALAGSRLSVASSMSSSTRGSYILDAFPLPLISPKESTDPGLFEKYEPQSDANCLESPISGNFRTSRRVDSGSDAVDQELVVRRWSSSSTLRDPQYQQNVQGSYHSDHDTATDSNEYNNDLPEEEDEGFDWGLASQRNRLDTHAHTRLIDRLEAGEKLVSPPPLRRGHTFSRSWDASTHQHPGLSIEMSSQHLTHPANTLGHHNVPDVPRAPDGPSTVGATNSTTPFAVSDLADNLGGLNTDITKQSDDRLPQGNSRFTRRGLSPHGQYSSPTPGRAGAAIAEVPKTPRYHTHQPSSQSWDARTSRIYFSQNSPGFFEESGVAKRRPGATGIEIDTGSESGLIIPDLDPLDHVKAGANMLLNNNAWAALQHWKLAAPTVPCARLLLELAYHENWVAPDGSAMGDVTEPSKFDRNTNVNCLMGVSASNLRDCLPASAVPRIAEGIFNMGMTRLHGLADDDFALRAYELSGALGSRAGLAAAASRYMKGGRKGKKNEARARQLFRQLE